MVAHRFFDHVSPFAGALTERVRRTLTRRERFALGEDIAPGEGPLPPEAIVESWMHRPGHRAVIRSPAYREMGVGVARDVPIDSELEGATFGLGIGSR